MRLRFIFIAFLLGFVVAKACGQGLTLRDVAFVAASGTGGGGGGGTSGGGGGITAPTFWWELDEDGTDDRIDSVSGLALTDHGTATFDSDTGVITNAFKFTGTANGAFLGTEITASLATTGTSLSMAWWHKASGSAASSSYWLDIYDAGESYQGSFYWKDYGPSFGIEIHAEGADDDSYLAIPYGTVGNMRDNTWRLMVIAWDSATGKVKYSQDGAAFTESTIINTIYSGAKAQLQIADAFTDPFYTDQLGLWIGYALTDADAAWLYNSGAGRTYSDF